MDSSSWKTAGAVSLMAALVLCAVGAADWGACVNGRQAMLNTAEPSILSEEWKRVLIIRGDIEQVPEGWLDRAKLVTPSCDEDAPLGEHYEWYLVAMLFALGSVACFGFTYVPKPKETKRQPRLSSTFRPQHSAKSDVIDVAKPIEISLDEISETDRDRDSKTLMAFVEERRVEASESELDETSAPRMEGFYVPPGYDNKPILYVDSNASSPSEEDTTRFRDLNAALKKAQHMVLAGAGGVQIRVAPGIYQSSIEIPSSVVVINQKLPDVDAKTRLAWIQNQELNDRDRMTLIADPKQKFGVRLGPGTRHGIFGCHIIGRDSVRQSGVFVERAETAAIVSCVISGFTESGVRAAKVGSELPGLGLVVAGSLIENNTAQLGGGIFAEESSVSIESCVLQHNRARNGGGVYVIRARHAVSIKATRLFENRAQLPETPNQDPMKLPLVQWGVHSGLGGGCYISSSHAKFVDVESIGNGASIAGGGIALLGSKALIQNDDHGTRFRANRARIGAGIASIGWPGNAGSTKVQEAQVFENDAQASGGGLAIIGHNVVQLIDCSVMHNKSSAGVGGGVSCHIGGQLDAQAGEISTNESKAHGGGIASINGRVRLGGQVQVHDNRAGGSGGGIFFVTEPCAVTEELIAHQHFDIPVRLVVDDATIRYNKCHQTGSGLRAGNLAKQPTLPIGIKVHQASVRSNTSASETTDVFVTWAGEVISRDVHTLKKRLLK